MECTNNDDKRNRGRQYVWMYVCTERPPQVQNSGYTTHHCTTSEGEGQPFLAAHARAPSRDSGEETGGQNRRIIALALSATASLSSQYLPYITIVQTIFFLQRARSWNERVEKHACPTTLRAEEQRRYYTINRSSIEV